MVSRREADKDPLKKQLDDVAKLKGNSFYGKMIEDLGRQKSIKLRSEERAVDNVLTSPFFDGLEEINATCEIKEFKRTIMTKGPYQCGTAVYQLANLRMLDFSKSILSCVTWILIRFT